MNYAYLSQVVLNTTLETPVYKQLRDGVRSLITHGHLQPNMKIPSSRFLATHYGLHRNTVVAALDELTAEGWLKSKGRKGVFVNSSLPVIKPVAYDIPMGKYPTTTGYTMDSRPLLFRKKISDKITGFDDGFPDGRLAPIKELGKAYTQTLAEATLNKSLSKYALIEGNLLLRNEMATMMRTYRGLPIAADNVMITKGCQNSLYLVSRCLLKKGDNVIVTDPNFLTSNLTFQSMGANLLKVGVDKEGMMVDEVERICKHKKIRALFITSHHHHPTTVTLAVERRIHLLQLAQRYRFIIIEDDYDYDFHYENKPLLPLAANDRTGNVIYIGSFSKLISHVFRVGYVIAPQNLIQELAAYRRIVDRQGDAILEKSIGKLLSDQVIKNNIRKAVNIYKNRRDHASELLKSALGEVMTFESPEGGLAFWCEFDKTIQLEKLAQNCLAHGLYFPDGSFYRQGQRDLNGCRLGFASMNEQEMEVAVETLKQSIRKK